MLKNWKFRLVLITVLCLSVFTAACGGGNSTAPAASNNAEKSNSAPVEIEFMHGLNSKIIDPIVDAYNAEQTKVKVKSTFVQGAYEGIIEKVQVQAAAKKSPDVVTNGFVYNKFAQDTLKAVSLQTFIDKENYDLTDFYPTMLNLGKAEDNTQFGLPFAVSTPIIFYNADLFREAGLDANTPPKTWEEVRDAAKKLTKEGQYGIFYDYQVTGNWIFQAMTESAGGSMIAPDNKSVGFDSDAGRKALQHWVDLVNTDKSMPALQSQQAMESFTSGKLGMYVTSTAALQVFKTGAKFEVRTALFPTENGKRVIPAGGANLIMLSKDAQKQDAAWDFIKYMTSAETTTKISQAIGYMVTRQSAYKDEALMGTFLKNNKDAEITYEQLPDMVPWYNFPGAGGSKVYKIVQDNIQAALLQQKTAEAALHDAAEAANKLLK